MPKSKKIQNKNQKIIYMDYASATLPDSRVLQTMTKISKECFSNASAIHDEGVRVKKKLEQSRGSIAEILQAHKDEIIFTSGATEANNLAIKGLVGEVCKNYSSCALPGVPVGTLGDNNFYKLPHVVTTNIEHASVLEVCRYLEKTGQAKVTYVGVEQDGIVDPKKIKKALNKNTVLVSVMYANNEIGTIQPLREIAKEIRHFQKTNKQKIFFHTDATQAINYLPINVLKLGVDLMSFNGGKIYGPKGVGILFKKRNITLLPIMHGGNQEFGLRAGTENVVSCVGMAVALEITEQIKDVEIRRLAKLRDYFISKLSRTLLDSKMLINGDIKNRLPNNINITIPKIPSDLLVIELSAKGVMASSKSACKAGDDKASHVIKAVRPEGSEVDGSLRFSLGRDTTKADINRTVGFLSLILVKLKKWYN